MCKHEFIGHAGGVKCSLCGAEMTTEEYRAYLKGEVKQEEIKVEAVEEKPIEKPAPPKPKQAPKKTTTKKIK